MAMTMVLSRISLRFTSVYYRFEKSGTVLSETFEDSERRQ